MSLSLGPEGVVLLYSTLWKEAWRGAQGKEMERGFLRNSDGSYAQDSKCIFEIYRPLHL